MEFEIVSWRFRELVGEGQIPRQFSAHGLVFDQSRHTQGHVILCIVISFTPLNKTMEENDIDNEQDYSPHRHTGNYEERNFWFLFQNSIEWSGLWGPWNINTSVLVMWLTTDMFASSPLNVTIEQAEVTHKQRPADGGDHTKDVSTGSEAWLWRRRSWLYRLRFVKFY